MLARKSLPVHRRSRLCFLEVYAGSGLWCYAAVGCPHAPERVLVKAVNWLGDLVMSLPALKAMRRAWPHSHLAVLVRRELASFLAGTRWIDEVIPYTLRPGIRRLADDWRIASAIRRRCFDVAVVFPNSFESALWPALAGIPERVGFRTDARGWLLTRSAGRRQATAQMHQMDAYLHMVEATLGIHCDAANGVPDIDPSRQRAMEAWLAVERRRPVKPLIALAPTAAFGSAKEWPATHYAALIDLLAEQHQTECVLIAGPAEQRRCGEVAASSRCGALIAAGATDVGEALALLSLCDGAVGNDSGATHVAAACGIPTVGLYGSTIPERTGIRGPRSTIIYRRIACSPCLQRTCRYGHYRCLEQISPQEVMEALDHMGALHANKASCNRAGPRI